MRSDRLVSRGLCLLLSLCLSLALLIPYCRIDVDAAPLVNAGFEDDLAGWTTYESVAIGTGGDYVNSRYTWTVLPYETKMALLMPSGSTANIFPTVADTLGLSDFSRTYLTTEFAGPSGVIDTTNFAYLYTDIAMTAGQELSMAWNYVATDYAPFNDAAFCTFVNRDNASDLALVNGYEAQLGILGATVAGTGNYTTGDYGSTGWQTAEFQAGEAGLYRLGFVVFNLSDTLYSPILFVDKEPGTTLKDGVPFAPIDPDDNAPPPPVLSIATVDTGDVDNLTATGARISAEVLADGYTDVTERGVVIGTAAEPTVDDSKQAAGSGMGTYQATFASLAPATLYYARAYAINSVGTAYGDEITFTTLPAAPVAVAATSVTEKSFAASWNAVDGATGYRLDVSADDAFASLLPDYDNLDVGNVLEKAVSGLSGGTPYYYRVRAYNGSGMGVGSNVATLTTHNGQTIQFTVSPMTYGDANVTLAGTTDSGLPIQYASSDPDVATIVGDVLHITGAGTTVITASQAGNADWSAAADVARTLTVATRYEAGADLDPDGATAETLKDNVLLPPPAGGPANQMRLDLQIDPRTDAATTGFMIAAQQNLTGGGRDLLQAFDIRLLLTVLRSDGSQETSPVGNDAITGDILVRLRVPQEFDNRVNLQVVYIDDAGLVTPYATTLVVIDGVKYLEFRTNHFSTYAITGDVLPVITDTGEAGGVTATATAGLALIAAAGVALAVRRRRLRGPNVG